jgi:hypothetical protein
MTAGDIGLKASAGCSITTNNSGGCEGSIKAVVADASATPGNLSFGMGGGPIKGELELNLGDYLTSVVGGLADAAKSFAETMRFLKGITSDAPAR